MKPAEILDFWINKGPKVWWTKNKTVDQEISERFADLHKKAAVGELSSWRQEPDPALALIILLDQFSRNMFRNDAKSFAQDEMALEIAKTSLANNFDEHCRQELRNFFYLPFMHSEKIGDQNRCISLAHQRTTDATLASAITHQKIIVRFGRFPHRNKVLGRHTTPAEEKFLKDGGFSG